MLKVFVELFKEKYLAKSLHCVEEGKLTVEKEFKVLNFN